MDVTSALQQAAVTIKSDPTGNSGATLIDATDIPNQNPALLTFFGVEGFPSRTDATQLDEVYEWAKQKTPNKTQEEIVEVLRDVRFRIGGTANLKDVHTYIKLRNQADMMGAQAKAMER